MGQTGQRSIATYILAVKIALAAAHFHGFGVARQGPWNTSVNKGKKRKDRARRRRCGVLVENKDTGPPFGQDESLLL